MADFHFSVLTQPVLDVAGDPGLAGLLRKALDEAGDDAGWEVSSAHPLWCSAHRPDAEQPRQGWKLHVSATPASAATVLERTLPVLLKGGSAFKFARTVEQVAQLTARHTPTGYSGKFLTVYPVDDEAAVDLARALDEVTAGLPGPRVLSDRPYRPGSLVHYRYGAFVEDRRISNDGLYRWMILDPDGNPVEDRRVGRYTPPPWVRCPFPDPFADTASGESPPAAPARGPMIGDRFEVREAVRRVNKGGVYRAVDTHTHARAIIKEARPHVAVDAAGRDVRDLLRAEAKALDALASQGIAPRPLALVEQDGHLFLAEEQVPGTSLREWVLDRIRAGGWRRNVPDALDMAVRLAALLEAAHAAGLVLRDFTPNNVMVLPDGTTKLIDLELAVTPEEDDGAGIGVGTPGFAAPEQVAGATAAVTADYYSLGASVCFLFMGSTPDLLDEDPPDRPRRERLAEWLRVRSTPDLPAVVHTLVLDLMDDDPRRRPTPIEVRQVLALASADRHAPSAHTWAPDAPAAAGVAPVGAGVETDRWDEAIDGIVEHLVTTMRPEDPDRLWQVSCASGSPDPCIVQLGAAGIVGPLTQFVAATGEARARAAVAAAGEWIIRRVQADDTRPPGLYFGLAGVAWALYEAGRVLGDEHLTQQGVALAETLPVSSPNPDITHGTAGIGMTLLHLGRRTGNPHLLHRAELAADALLESAEDGPDGLLWATPAAFDSRLAGGRFYGFAHGTAGVAAFLLATARPECVDMAVRAGKTLSERAVVQDGIAQWGAGPGAGTTAPYWCHGAAGVGTFLTRLHVLTGDAGFGLLADQAAAAVMENSGRGVLGQCHGLAGNGDFLLDLAHSTGSERYLELATDIARVVLASRARRGRRMVFPNEEGVVSPAWADGGSGVLSFLLRLRFPAPRPWMAEAPFGGLG